LLIWTLVLAGASDRAGAFSAGDPAAGAWAKAGAASESVATRAAVVMMRMVVPFLLERRIPLTAKCAEGLETMRWFGEENAVMV
jgi:hypothetical protein